MGIDPVTHRPRTDLNYFANLPQLLAAANLLNPCWDNINALRLQSDATQLAKLQLVQNILQILGAANNNNSSSNMEGMMINPNSFSLSQDQNLYEYLKMPSLQLEGSSNNASVSQTGFGQSSDFINFPCMENSNPNQAFCNEGGVHHQLGSNPSSISASDAFPQLGSSSAECSTMNQMENKITPREISSSNPSPSLTTTYEAWGNLMDDIEGGDSYWKDIIK